MRKAVHLILIASIGLASSIALGARPVFAIGLSNDKPIIKETLSRGERLQGTVTLLNTDTEAIVARVYLQDWQYEPSGDSSKKFEPPGTLKRSCASWIHFMPGSAEVPGRGGKVEVEYIIEVPEDPTLEGSYQAVLFYEADMPTPLGQENEVAVKFLARVGSLITVEIKDTVRREARMEPVTMSPPTASSPIKLSTRIANEGNTWLKCAGSFHAMQEGMVAGRGEMPTRFIWPGDTVSAEGEWSGRFKPGTYSVVVTFDCGEGLVLVEEAETTVTE